MVDRIFEVCKVIRPRILDERKLSIQKTEEMTDAVDRYRHQDRWPSVLGTEKVEV
jgi:hypothetical protein